ncbi:MAG TPA: hypothetical protein VNE18_12010 [Rhodanobacter sp.]|nr:hypothetical protein [Rhodanobacter sp.]
MVPEIIEIPRPPMGGKCWLLERKGLFVLEQGPGTIRTLAITAAGSGQLEVIDGIPDERGFFSDEAMPVPEPYTDRELPQVLAAARDKRIVLPPDVEAKRAAHIAWGKRVGRPYYRACPIVMGSWMLDAGFIHGLTIKSVGDHSGVNAFCSIVWMPFGRGA